MQSLVTRRVAHSGWALLVDRRAQQFTWVAAAA
jgi:hypothetical protein